jgi:FixJ family two-component response regulator
MAASQTPADRISSEIQPVASESDSSSDLQPQHLVVFTEDAEMSAFFGERLGEGFEVDLGDSEDQLLARVAESGDVALVVLDLAEARQAFTLRERISEANAAVPVALMMAAGDEEVAVEALKRGFVDYIAKRKNSLQTELVRKRIESSIELSRLRSQNRSLQDAIEASQQRLFNIYDSLDDVIVQIDQDCRVVSANRSAAALANCEPRDAVGKACWELFDFHPCERRAKKEECHIYRTFLDDETLRGERADAKSDETHEYMTFITTLDDKDFVVYRETDVTEKRRLEARIANALASLGVPPTDED